MRNSLAKSHNFCWHGKTVSSNGPWCFYWKGDAQRVQQMNTCAHACMHTHTHAHSSLLHIIYIYSNGCVHTHTHKYMYILGTQTQYTHIHSCCFSVQLSSSFCELVSQSFDHYIKKCGVCFEVMFFNDVVFCIIFLSHVCAIINSLQVTCCDFVVLYINSMCIVIYKYFFFFTSKSSVKQI